MSVLALGSSGLATADGMVARRADSLPLASTSTSTSAGARQPGDAA
jgi:hypothetical protein